LIVTFVVFHTSEIVCSIGNVCYVIVSKVINLHTAMGTNRVSDQLIEYKKKLLLHKEELRTKGVNTDKNFVGRISDRMALRGSIRVGSSNPTAECSILVIIVFWKIKTQKVLIKCSMIGFPDNSYNMDPCYLLWWTIVIIW
jgi:hypothetical protein